VYIELTDHLRCPESHEEAYLVLLPDQVDHRDVVAGHLGCPICGWSCAWTDRTPDFGGGWRSDAASPCASGSDAQALLGIDGPGGWIALAGSAGRIALELQESLPGVGIVAVNPPADLRSSGTISVLLSGTWPLKAHAIRGAILGSDATAWTASALASVLPGLRIVGAGPRPEGAAEVIGEAGGVWVAKRR
jgi:hypothetical protein